MKKFFSTAFATTLISAAVALSFSPAAEAQPRNPPRHVQPAPKKRPPPPRVDRRWQGGPSARNWDASRHYQAPARNYRARRMTRNDWVYRGNDGRYYCRRGDGTTGLVIGGVIGGVLGNNIGGDALSTLIGAAGGAALGHAIDRGQVSCR
jgi:hypothetical protein